MPGLHRNLLRTLIVGFLFLILLDPRWALKSKQVTVYDFIRKNLDKSNIAVGCWIEKNLNYRDKHYNCSTKKSSLSEDGSCVADNKMKYGPQIPSHSLKNFNITLSRISLSFLKGKLNQIDFTVVQPTDHETLKQRVTAGKDKHGLVSGKEIGVAMFNCQNDKVCVSVTVQLPWNTSADDDCKVE